MFVLATRYFFLALVLLWGAPPAVLSAETRQCESGIVSVAGGDSKEFAFACSGASKAIDFMARCGLSFDTPLLIQFERDMREECGPDTYAIFTVADKSIRINGIGTCRQLFDNSALTGYVGFETFFESIVVHEVTHFIIDDIGTDPTKRRLAQEYIAYVAQYSGFEPSTRQSLAADLGIEPGVALSDLSTVIYGLSAEKFAMMALTHFSGPDGGCKTIRDLVHGDRQMRESVHPQ